MSIPLSRLSMNLRGSREIDGDTRIAVFRGGLTMIEPLNYLLISVTTFCFGLLVSFQISHIFYCRKLTKLAKRCVNTGTIAPVLVELEEEGK
jgi:hypothetical protein